MIGALAGLIVGLACGGGIAVILLTVHQAEREHQAFTHGFNEGRRETDLNEPITTDWDTGVVKS